MLGLRATLEPSHAHPRNMSRKWCDIVHIAACRVFRSMSPHDILDRHESPQHLDHMLTQVCSLDLSSYRSFEIRG